VELGCGVRFWRQAVEAGVTEDIMVGCGKVERQDEKTGRGDIVCWQGVEILCRGRM
jgi:hypothetical protein